MASVVPLHMNFWTPSLAHPHDYTKEPAWLAHEQPHITNSALERALKANETRRCKRFYLNYQDADNSRIIIISCDCLDHHLCICLDHKLANPPLVRRQTLALEQFQLIP
jgi:hypothetical protein